MKYSLLVGALVAGLLAVHFLFFDSKSGSAEPVAGVNCSSLSFSNPASITIPNSGIANPYPSAINVSGMSGTVSRVAVTIRNLSHVFPDDIDILLAGPSGQRIILMSDAGGGDSLTNRTYTFDDTAASIMADASFNFDGIYRPTNHGAGDTFAAPAPAGPYSNPQLLSVFNGTDPNGTWSLYVVDDQAGSLGNINGGWSVEITTGNAGCTPTPTATPTPPPTGRYTNPTPILIQGSLSMGKANPYPSTISVAGASGLITGVSVTLNNVQHQWGRDIDVLLVGPQGQKFVVMADVGQGQGLDNPATITLSDAGSGLVTNGSAPIQTGVYKPTNYNDIGVNDTDTFDVPAPVGPYNHPAPTGNSTFGSVFNQSDPNGTWSLYIMDDASSNSGVVSGGWTLDIATGAPAENNMQFASANFNSAAGGLAIATVIRANGGTNPVTVDYQTSGGTATGGGSCSTGIDFINTSGTLSFAANENSRTFQVQLCPDSTLEPNETVSLRLSNPTGGAFIGTPGTATITIVPVGTSATQFCNTNRINIPISGSVAPYPSTVGVSGMDGVVTSAKVTLNNIQHSWGSDIDVLLVSPSGRKFVPMSDVGESDGFDQPTTVTLTDLATGDLLNVGQQIVSGAYKPTNLEADDAFPTPAPGGPYSQPAPAGTSTFANVFNNTPANGDWKLFVTDDSSAAGGSIESWCIDLTAGAPVVDAIQFKSENFNRRVDTTSDIPVVRPNTSVGAVSIDFATTNGTAIGGSACAAGIDYVSASGTLNFADGETVKNVRVQLCADSSPEPESFTITLSNPQGGAVIGTPSNATVNIYNGDLPCDITWTRAQSPKLISGTNTILRDEVVCIESGTTVQFTQTGKLNLYGELRSLGTAADRVRLQASNVFPNRVEVAGIVKADFTDVMVPLNVNQGGTMTITNSNFGLYGTVMTFPGIITQRLPRFVSLEKVVFDSKNDVQSQNAQLYAVGLYLLLKDVTFRHNSFFNVGSSIIKFENVRSEDSAYEGFSFANGNLQPLLVENISASNCVRAGLDLFSGDFHIGDNVTIQNCEYPMSGPGGLVPGSVLPLTGNRNNWIEVGQPGGTVTYTDVGLPYVVSEFSDIGGIEFLPGVTLKARPSFNFNTGNNPLRVLGRPGAPVTFEPFQSGQQWYGGQFNFTGNRMDYVVLSGMSNGVSAAEGSGGDYYIDNSVIRNNYLGVKDKLNSNGSAFLQTNLFTQNTYAIAAENARIQAQQRTNPNLFENNQTAVTSISAPDVRFNWWNSPTGPTTPDNPGGTGDVIEGGARFFPFVTVRPDTADRPPVVRMPRVPYRGILGSYQGLLDAGRKVIIHWDASDDRRIVKQKILFSPEFNSRKAFTVIADDLPPEQRSFEFTVPSVGYIQTTEAFVRIVAVDEKGQEGFDDWQALVPSGDIYGELTITADVAGRTFRPGDEIPFPYQITQGFPEGGVDRYMILDSDRKVVPYGANTVAIMPNVSTDTARFLIVYKRSLNQQKFFFSEPFSIRYDERFPDTPPAVTIDSPTEGQQFGVGESVNIQWSGSDDEAIRYYNIQTSSDNGRTWIQIAERLPAGTTNYTWRPEVRSSINDIRVRVIAVDRRYQNSSSTRRIAITGPSNLPPTVELTYPAPNAVYTVGQSTFIAASAADPDGTIQRVEFYAKGGSPTSDPTLIGSDTKAPYQVPWIYPFAQPYIITAKAFDDRNREVTTAPITVTVNPFNPAPLPIPRPELFEPQDGAVFPAPADITLVALPAPTHRSYVRVEFYNGTTLIGTDTSAPYSLTVNDLPAGRYTFFVKSVADNDAESISNITDVTVGGTTRTGAARFDFDGDGRSDISVYRNGIWYLERSLAGGIAEQFGLPSDRITPADYDGDGKADLAVFRSGVWYVQKSADSSVSVEHFGLSGDIAQAGDYDGDSRADFAVFRPSNGTWYIKQGSGYSVTQFGLADDLPVAADRDADGKVDIGVFRPSNGNWYWISTKTGAFKVEHFGQSGDIPVIGDFDADGKANLAVYRPANGTWYIAASQGVPDQSFTAVQFGLSSDIPVPADFDGDGRTDIAVYRNGTWFILNTTSGLSVWNYGLAGDVPVPSALVR